MISLRESTFDAIGNTSVCITEPFLLYFHYINDRLYSSNNTYKNTSTDNSNTMPYNTLGTMPRCYIFHHSDIVLQVPMWGCNITDLCKIASYVMLLCYLLLCLQKGHKTTNT